MKDLLCKAIAEEITDARAEDISTLVEITQKVIRDACSLLGIECPEEM